jgi:1,2-diacylglycerol 3-alpha-glucosyltransferase
MKIVMLCEFFNDTLEYQENLLIKYYVKQGHQVTVITSTFESVWDYYEDRHDNSVPPRTYTHNGAKIIKLAFRYNILNRLRAYTSIDRILEDETPDLIYVHDIMLNFPECIHYVKTHPECRMIMDYHADYSNSGKHWLSRRVLHGIIRKRFLDRARPHLARIFPIVPASTKFLHEVYKVPHSEMELLPLGADVDLAREIRTRKEGRMIREALSISQDAVVIITGGKLTPHRRTELLIDAVAQLPQYPIHTVVVGEASKTSDIDQAYKRELIARSKGLSIHFVGWLDNFSMYRHLDMADLAVFPSGQSILWQQAIAAGLPLIVGNRGNQDISYLNLHRNIIILEREQITVQHIAEAIANVVSDSSRMQEMRTGAALVADERLNWNRLIGRTLQFQPKRPGKYDCNADAPGE